MLETYWLHTGNLYLDLGLFLVFGYLIGSLQSAYFVGRVFGKIDIREHGSGNAGMTNVMRVMGPMHGLFVLIFDASKSMFVIIWAAYAFNGGLGLAYGFGYVPLLLTGFGVVLGHCHPFYLKFKGGKGIASTIGIVIMFDWRILVIATVVGALSVVIASRISVASITSLLAFSISTTFLYFSYPAVYIISWVITLFCILRHKSNIKRLINGEEKRLSFKKS